MNNLVAATLLSLALLYGFNRITTRIDCAALHIDAACSKVRAVYITNTGDAK